ncbi:MAG TPA: ABC transporter permease [Chloroflexota bacterium]|nr:ABC transporter permease [Chloroflexota bacterium]
MAFLSFFIKRFIAMIVVVWAITTLVFFLAHASPYDPIRLILGQKYLGDPRGYRVMRHLFGLDQSVWQQYTNYLGGLLHGDLGYSEEQTALGTPVWDMIRSGVPQSVKLGGWALLVGLLVGLPSGLISALRQNKPVADHANQFVMMLMFAVPVFVLAPIAQLIFGVELKWLPVAGWGDPGLLGVKEMIMPVGLFAMGIAGYFSKSFRSFLLEVLSQDYIRTARAKGLKQRVIIYLHAIKNTLLPLATIIGPTIAFLVTGAFIIESFFNIPGIGSITVTAATSSDYPVIEATTILIAIAVVVMNFLTDVFYAMVDPRVRLE